VCSVAAQSLGIRIQQLAWCYSRGRELVRLWIGSRRSMDSQNDNKPEVENKTILSRRSLQTMLWNPHMPHAMTILRSGASFDVPWSVDQNSSPLLRNPFQCVKCRARKLAFHIASASFHHSKMTQNFLEHNLLNKLPCPLHLANISPVDFCRF
jgi:hypothetical protein